MELSPKHFHAPELYGDYWFNSEPISIRALHGYVLLMDFWDYSCVNCVRTLPYMNEWYRRYREYGLVVVGIHTPEFKFGANPEHVERVIREQEIRYPVVTDNDARLWSAYGNRSWPTKHLVDKDGFIRYSHSGEGVYEQFERAIQALLNEAGIHGQFPPLMEPLRESDREGVLCYRQSNELYVGYLRGTMGNVEGYSPESTVEHSDSGLYLPGRFYLEGRWTDEKEFVRFSGEGSGEGHIGFRYEASEVNGVLGVEPGKMCELVVEQDGKMLTAENKGNDVVLDERGVSRVRVIVPGMYNLVKNSEFGAHILRLKASCATMKVYTFTFVTSAIPELVSNN